MKSYRKSILLIALACASSSAMAQYKEIRSPNSGELYRDDDVFVFCTQGRKPEFKAWKPIHAGTATWMPLYNHCPIPHDPSVITDCPANTQYYRFLNWKQDDWDAYVLYTTVCPWGGMQGKKGDWQGDGNPENSPHNH